MDLWAMKHRNDTIASSLAISFASRVVKEVTRQPRALTIQSYGQATGQVHTAARNAPILRRNNF